MNFQRTVLTALTITVLVAGTAQAGTHGHGKFSVRKVGHFSGVKCQAFASSAAVKSSKDAAVIALAGAFDTACKLPDAHGHVADHHGYVQKMEVAYAGWAEVFAKVVTKAAAKCQSTGSAYGCAAASSSAHAYATASAKAFAAAGAAAVSKCGCVHHVKKDTLAAAFGAAATFNKLIAEAYSSVEAAVCVEHKQAASAHIHQVCLASALTKVFAKASAKALAASSCYHAKSKAQIKAITGAVSYITEGCKKHRSTTGNGHAGTRSKGKGKVTIKDFSKHFKNKLKFEHDF